MKKFISIVLIGLLCGVTLSHPVYMPAIENMEDVETDGVIRIWYTDESLSSYIDNAAISYYGNTGVHVVPTLVSGVEYLENIQKETLEGDEAPDLFICGNDALERAALSGLAVPVADKESVLTTGCFPQVALDAVTYENQYMGYPFYYETSLFLYNKTYLQTMNSEDPSADILPRSLVGILEFSNQYDPPEGMEVFLKWDVSDILYNYSFAGAYMDLGGPCGDDRERIDLYNANAMYGLGVFQDFNQFFSIESKETTYESVMEEFMAGKVMFTFAGTDAIAKLEQAREEGTFTYEYGIAPMEMLNTTLQAKPLSITNTVVINGYGTEQEIAEDFAVYLTCEYVDTLYSRSGKMSSCNRSEYEYDSMEGVYETYYGSVPLPKIAESGNYWVLAELCYTNIWEGEDVNASLLSLANKMNGQIFGESTPVTEIPTPEIDESYIQSE